MKLFVVLLALFLSGSALAAKPYHVESLMLLQPEFVLKERVAVEDLANYFNAVNAAGEQALADGPGAKPAAGFIAIAVRPGGESKVWLDLSPALDPLIAERLRTSMQQVPPFKAKGGVVVFAIKATLWGATPTDREGPAPAEWEAFMRSADAPMEVGEMVERMWASEASGEEPDR